jgi:hypothetical protein
LFFIEKEYIKKIVANWKYLLIFINFYKKTSFVFVVYEIFLFIFLIGLMLITCLKVINLHYSVF